jgi:hypothetical protein
MIYKGNHINRNKKNFHKGNICVILLYPKEIQLAMSYSNLAQDLAKEGTGTFMNLLSNSARFSKLNVAIFFTRTYKTVTESPVIK